VKASPRLLAQPPTTDAQPVSCPTLAPCLSIKFSSDCRAETPLIRDFSAISYETREIYDNGRPNRGATRRISNMKLTFIVSDALEKRAAI
jgi:hypothetical protein